MSLIEPNINNNTIKNLNTLKINMVDTYATYNQMQEANKIYDDELYFIQEQRSNNEIIIPISHYGDSRGYYIKSTVLESLDFQDIFENPRKYVLYVENEGYVDIDNIIYNSSQSADLYAKSYYGQVSVTPAYLGSILFKLELHTNSSPGLIVKWYPGYDDTSQMLGTVNQYLWYGSNTYPILMSPFPSNDSTETRYGITYRSNDITINPSARSVNAYCFKGSHFKGGYFTGQGQLGFRIPIFYNTSNGQYQIDYPVPNDNSITSQKIYDNARNCYIDSDEYGYIETNCVYKENSELGAYVQIYGKIYYAAGFGSADIYEYKVFCITAAPNKPNINDDKQKITITVHNGYDNFGDISNITQSDNNFTAYASYPILMSSQKTTEQFSNSDHVSVKRTKQFSLNPTTGLVEAPGFRVTTTASYGFSISDAPSNPVDGQLYFEIMERTSV